MSGDDDYEKHLDELREWWAKVHPALKADLMRIASGGDVTIPSQLPLPPESLDDDAWKIKDLMKDMNHAILMAKSSIWKALLYDGLIEVATREFLAKGHNFEELKECLWYPVSTSESLIRYLVNDSELLGRLLQELDWAIDPDPKFLDERLERLKHVSGMGEEVVMMNEAIEMRKGWLENMEQKTPPNTDP